MTDEQATRVRRRTFIGLAGAGAAAGLISEAHPGVLGPRVRWRPDGAGALARIGLLTPAWDPVPESETWAMAPPGVSIHASRVGSKRGDPRSFAEPPHIDTAVELLAALRPRVIVSAYTGSSYALGADADDALRARLEALAPGAAVLLTAPAAAEALHFLDVRRVALVHPPWFSDQVNSQGRDYFRSRGFDVVSCARMTPLRDFSEVAPEEVHDWIKANVPRQAEAVLVGGNGLRAVGVIQALENALGRPVLTANQVALWRALRVAGVVARVPGYGRLFERDAASKVKR